MELNARIFVAGHNGMVGSAIVRKLKELGYTNIITFSSLLAISSGGGARTKSTRSQNKVVIVETVHQHQLLT